MTKDQKSKQPLKARSLFPRLGASLLLGLCFVVANAQSTADLINDKPERNERLSQKAKEEGALSIYTAFRPQDMPLIIAPFERQTGIKVKYWRSGSDNVLQRVVREASSKHQEVDLIMTPASEMYAMYKEHLLQPVYSPYFKDLMPTALSEHRQWTSFVFNVMVQSYNTNLIKSENLPKQWSDLSDPRWKGNLGIETKAEEWFSKVVTTMGEEKGISTFKDIVSKNGISTRLGVSLLHNLVVAGEVPMGLTVYIDLPEKDKKAGKPVDWFALDPVVAQGFNVGVYKNPQHPYAALLFYDYLLSAETQKLLAQLNYYTTSTKVPNNYPNLKINVVDPIFIIDNYAKWTRLYEQTVTKVPK
jgi:iron(III) transport system substrate-binding protein